MKFIMTMIFFVLFITVQSVLTTGPWSRPQDSPEARARALLANLTQDEKLSMLHGPVLT